MVPLVGNLLGLCMYDIPTCTLGACGFLYEAVRVLEGGLGFVLKVGEVFGKHYDGSEFLDAKIEERVAQNL